MFKRAFFAAALAAATPLSAHADEINYNYIELGLDRGDYGDGDLIQDGRNLSGSFAIADSFYIAGMYRNAELNSQSTFWGLDFRGETDFDYWNLDFGYHQSLNANNDFIAEIGYETSRLETKFYVDDVLDFHDKSTYANFNAAIGLRTSISSHWENRGQTGDQANTQQ